MFRKFLSPPHRRDSGAVEAAIAMSRDVASDARNLREQLEPYLAERDPLMAFMRDAYNKREGAPSRGD